MQDSTPPIPAQSEDGCLSDCQSRLEADINEARPSGGVPRASILAKALYGSVLLPEARIVE